jgi:type I restriction enzyme, S subunit
VDVSPGFRRTDAGIVPEGWGDALLAVLAETSSGTTPARALQDRYYKRGSIAWVKTMDLTNSDIRSTSECVTDLALKETSLSLYPIGTVLVAMYGGFQQIGRTGLLRLPAAVNQAITAIQPKSEALVPEYLLATLNHRVAYWRTVASSSRKDPNITSHEVRSFPIAYPEPNEQRAIAAALGDVDALLGGLDRLIAKKRDLKQAAMQQLLTGQARLPGFSDGWEEKRLGELAEIVSGGTPKTGEPAYWNGGIKWCTPTDITSCQGKYLVDTERSISQLGLNSSGARLLPAGALLLCSRATIGELKIAGRQVCTNQGFKSLICPPGVCNEFLYYKLATMKAQMVERAFGSTFLEISKANVAALEISTPPLPEQTAIAAVLSDMDAELSALEARRTKTRALKQAMMQELLTGKIRLV